VAANIDIIFYCANIFLDFFLVERKLCSFLERRLRRWRRFTQILFLKAQSASGLLSCTEQCKFCHCRLDPQPPEKKKGDSDFRQNDRIEKGVAGQARNDRIEKGDCGSSPQ
jgi:hypothetical protein